MPRKTYKMPYGGRYTSSGRITITIRTEVDGQIRRLAHSKVLASEPKTYATLQGACEGYDRVMAHLEKCAANGETLRGFWSRWIDPDHFWNEERSESTVTTYASRTKGFVNFRDYGDLPLAAFTLKHLEAYRENGGLLGQVGTISRIFMDARRRGLIAANPFADEAAKAEALVTKRAKEKAKKNPPPKIPAVEAMLARLGSGPFPASLLGWFVTGTETGMRGGEIDAMEWEYLDATGIYAIEWQWHHKLCKLTPPKHHSERKLALSDRVLEAIERQRGNGSRYIWTDPERAHWTHNTRGYWWEWDGDGGPTPRALVGGATMYRATRHHWASKALNEWKMSAYAASLLYGHKDGGKLLIETYVDGDHEKAMRDARDAANHMHRTVVDLSARRAA